MGNLKLSEETLKALKENKLSSKVFVSESTEEWYNVLMSFNDLWNKTDSLIGKSYGGENVESYDPTACKAFEAVYEFLENCLCDMIKDHIGDNKNGDTL